MTDIGMSTLGEYRGDVTRDTFAPSRQIRRVISQQGRVVLDADLNEQSAILLHYLQSLARDLGGPHFGRDDSFKVGNLRAFQNGIDFDLTEGHYYVGGVLCENQGARLAQQPFVADAAPRPAAENGAYLAYLDVWERHLTPLQVPELREVALGQIDTAARSQTVWQVRLLPLGNLNQGDLDQFKPGAQDAYRKFKQLLKDKAPFKPGSGQLRARVSPAQPSDSPCMISPSSRYRGPENQLYRVEVHGAGAPGSGATFKWSRENSSVYFPIKTLSGTQVTLHHLGRDDRFGLKQLDWVELVDDDQTLAQGVSKLVQVKSIDRETLTVTLSDPPTTAVGQNPATHPMLRRWDQRKPSTVDNALPITASTTDWIALEDGIEVQFPPPTGGATARYETGDFWLIPARVATGDIEWPRDSSGAVAQRPHGGVHHYAPLAAFIVNGVGGDGKITTSYQLDCRVSS